MLSYRDDVSFFVEGFEKLGLRLFLMLVLCFQRVKVFKFFSWGRGEELRYWDKDILHVKISFQAELCLIVWNWLIFPYIRLLAY